MVNIGHVELNNEINGWFKGVTDTPTTLKDQGINSSFSLDYKLIRDAQRLFDQSTDFNILEADLDISHYDVGYPVAFEVHHFSNGLYLCSGFGENEDERKKYIRTALDKREFPDEMRILLLQEGFDISEQTKLLAKKVWNNSSLNVVIKDFKIPEDVRVQLKEAAKEHNLINRLVGAYL
jgi:hypothetical protein